MRSRSSRYTRAIASVVACALAVGLAVLVAEPGARAAQSDGWASGVYPGPCKNTQQPGDKVKGDHDRAAYLSQLQAFAKWRGQPVQFTMQFAPYEGVTNWLTTEEPNSLLKCAVYVRQQLHVPMMFAVPMLPLYDTEALSPPPGTLTPTLVAGAAGDYDQYWKTLATNLVSSGLGDTVMRIGWEFNGNWFRWSAMSDPAAWKAYWIHIVKAMRSVPGQSFKFDYSVALGSTYANPDSVGSGAVYPGDAYVDTVSVSLYDQWYGQPACTSTGVPVGCKTENARWSNLVNQKYGLTWLATFTHAHHKQIGFSEWALASTGSFCDPKSGKCGGGGDDADFMTDFHTWLVQPQHDIAYETYFDKDHQKNVQMITDGKGHDSVNFPDAEDTYQRLWSVTSGHSPSASVLPSGYVPPSSSTSSSSPTQSVTQSPSQSPSTSPSTSPSQSPSTKPPVKLPINTPLYSLVSNRTHAKKLGKQKVKSNIYVFVRPSRPVLYAAWYLDDPKHKKKAYRMVRFAPYDLVGKKGKHALAFHVYGVTKGTHKLTVMLRWKSGGYKTYTVTFIR